MASVQPLIYLLDDNASTNSVAFDGPDSYSDLTTLPAEDVIQRMEGALSVLEHNLDDLYLVTFTILTFGWITEFQNIKIQSHLGHIYFFFFLPLSIILVWLDQGRIRSNLLCS